MCGFGCGLTSKVLPCAKSGFVLRFARFAGKRMSLMAKINLENLLPINLPAPVPEIPVTDLNKGVEYYVNVLGFKLDWRGEEDGIAGISRGKCRLFLTDGSFRESYGNAGPVLFWINLASKAEVDELFGEWQAAGAKIVSEPEDKAWKLREFVGADIDGNLIRVFYDFRWDQ